MRTVDKRVRADEVVYVQVRHARRGKDGIMRHTDSETVTVPGAPLKKVVEVIRRAIREAA